MSKNPKVSEVPTTPPAPCAPAATPKAAASGRSRKSPDWDKVKVFSKPEYRTPYKLTMYMAGKKPKVWGTPDLWLQVAIESGLVEMGSLEGGGRVGELLDPLDGNPPAYATAEDLQTLIAKGMADLLPESASKEDEEK